MSAERRDTVHVAGEVRIELAAGVARVGRRTVDVDVHHRVDAVRARISDLRDQGRGEFALDEEIPALVVAAVEIRRERHGAGAGQVGVGRRRGRRLDRARP